MNNDIYSADYVAALPPKIRNDPELKALGETIAQQLRSLAVKTKGCTLYSRIDELDEVVLDTLANDFKVDWYSPDYTLSEKRATIKNSFKVHKMLGTKAAIETALGDVYKGAKVEEWFDYGGKPYEFRVEVDVTFQDADVEKHKKVLERAEYYKNLRSHMSQIEYVTMPNGKATTYAAIACVAIVTSIETEVEVYGLE